MDNTHLEHDPIAHCSGLVSQQDEDLALCLPYLKENARAGVLALYAVQLALRQIPAQVSEPPLGEIRLQWWRDRLDDVMAGNAPRGHPVLQAIAQSGSLNAQTRSLIEIGLDERARLLYPEPFSDRADVMRFYAKAEGWLIAALLPMVDADRAMAAGAKYALSRWGYPGAVPTSDSAPSPHHHRHPEIDEAKEINKADPKSLSLPQLDDAAPVAFLRLRRGYARRSGAAKRPLSPLNKRIMIFTAVATGRV